MVIDFVLLINVLMNTIEIIDVDHSFLFWFRAMKLKSFSSFAKFKATKQP